MRERKTGQRKILQGFSKRLDVAAKYGRPFRAYADAVSNT
jgi:hypothetical protein